MDQPGSGVSGPRQPKPALEAVTHVGWLLVAAEAQDLAIGISSSPDQSRNITAISSESVIQKTVRNVHFWEELTRSSILRTTSYG